MARHGKKILDIRKTGWNAVDIDYFDTTENTHKVAGRRVHFPDADKSGNGAYIVWEGEKKIVESLYL